MSNSTALEIMRFMAQLIPGEDTAFFFLLRARKGFVKKSVFQVEFYRMENKTLILIKGSVIWQHDYYLHHRLQLGLNCWKPTPAVFSGSSIPIVCPQPSVLSMSFYIFCHVLLVRTLHREPRVQAWVGGSLWLTSPLLL